LANVVIGYLWDAFGSSVPFMYSAVTSALALVSMAAFLKAKP